MARNVPLGTVRSQVKAETQKSLQTTSTTQDSEINQIIFDTQQWLSSEYDWPFLKARWDVAAALGSRYLSFPTVDDDGLTTAINFERAGQLRLYVKWNQVWQTVDYGIRELEEFNYIDSDRGMVLDPIQRWQFDDEGKFEIWPMPASSQTLRFTGQRTNTELRSSAFGTLPITWDDTKTLDLDDLMVTYYAAAEYCLREKSIEVAKMFLANGATRMSMIRATYPVIQKPATIIGGSSKFDRRSLRVVPMVVVGGH